jgi:hypothetical protein
MVYPSEAAHVLEIRPNERRLLLVREEEEGRFDRKPQETSRLWVCIPVSRTRELRQPESHGDAHNVSNPPRDHPTSIARQPQQGRARRKFGCCKFYDRASRAHAGCPVTDKRRSELSATSALSVASGARQCPGSECATLTQHPPFSHWSATTGSKIEAEVLHGHLIEAGEQWQLKS